MVKVFPDMSSAHGTLTSAVTWALAFEGARWASHILAVAPHAQGLPFRCPPPSVYRGNSLLLHPYLHCCAFVFITQYLGKLSYSMKEGSFFLSPHSNSVLQSLK